MMGIRSLILSAASQAIAVILAGAGNQPTAFDRARAEEQALRNHFGKHPPKRASDATDDPYFAMGSRGRNGAHARQLGMAAAFAGTAVGKRQKRGRDVSNPFTKRARRDAFANAIVSGLSRAAAAKVARRVAV